MLERFVYLQKLLEVKMSLYGTIKVIINVAQTADNVGLCCQLIDAMGVKS